MIVHEKSKHVALRLREPGKVLNIMPAARAVNLPAGEYVLVPHGVTEARVLNNMGIKAPSPIKHYYDWPGRFNPFHAQEETAAFLTLNSRAFVLNELGTGKSMSVLWAWDYLRSIGETQKLLIVAPLSTLERTWGDEIFGSFPHLDFAVLHGTKEQRLKLLADTSYDIYIINHHGIKVIEQELLAREDIDTVVIDEIATFRSGRSGLFKSAKKLVDKRARVWGLTGTPTPNEPTDAWGQCRLISPERVPTYFGRFRDMTMKKVSQFSYVPRSGAMDMVFEAMQPSVRFTRDECVDLPPVIYQTYEAELSADQKRTYKTMMTQLVAEYEDEQVLAVNEAVKASKLLQICCGVIYGSGEDVLKIEAKKRIEVTKEIIEASVGKVIVFVPFRGALDYVAEELSKDYTVGIIHGGVSKGARDDVFARFQREDDPQVLLAQPAAMSHGLTLVVASTVVWYSPVMSNEIYEQANGRITRPGQKNTQFIVNIEGSAIERRFYKRLQTKQKMQGVLLDMLKEGI